MTRGFPPDDRRRVLVVAPNWLGDVVMTTPLLTWLDEARRSPGVPVYTISLAVRAAWAPLFAGDERIDELLTVERPGRHDGVRGIAEQAARWRGGRFDAVLLGPPSLRAALTARLAGIDLRIGHRGDGRAALLTVALPRAARGSRHYTREMLDLGAALAAAWDWPHQAPAGDGPAATRLAAPGGRVRERAGRPVWVLGPGATFGPAKNWPVEPMAEFIGAAVGERGVRFVLLGDAAAADIVARLRGRLPALAWRSVDAGIEGDEGGEGDVLDLTGRTSLAEAVTWVCRAQAFVGNDSGMMHVAAAMGTPTVGLFGSSNPDWTRPSGAAVEVVAADGFACRPCYRRTCNQPVFCLGTIEARRVLAAVARLVDGDPGAREGSVVR